MVCHIILFLFHCKTLHEITDLYHDMIDRKLVIECISRILYSHLDALSPEFEPPRRAGYEKGTSSSRLAHQHKCGGDDGAYCCSKRFHSRNLCTKDAPGVSKISSADHNKLCTSTKRTQPQLPEWSTTIVMYLQLMVYGLEPLLWRIDDGIDQGHRMPTD